MFSIIFGIILNLSFAFNSFQFENSNDHKNNISNNSALSCLNNTPRLAFNTNNESTAPNSLPNITLFSVSSLKKSPYGFYQTDTVTLEWKDHLHSTRFILFSRIQMNSYVSFAFSHDTQMGDDEVIVCKAMRNSTGLISFQLEHYYNPFKSAQSKPELILASNPLVGLSNVSFSYSDGYIECTFIRAKSVNNTTNYFYLNKFYYLLTAYGPVDESNGKYT